MDALVMLWANARVAHLLSVHRMATEEVGHSLKEEVDTDGYDQLKYTQNVETIEPFSSHIVPVKAGRAYTEEHINVMVQALQTEDGSLPQGLTVQNTYTNTAYSHIILWKKTPVARAVAVLPVPTPPEEEQLLEGADESHKPHTPRLTIRQRHGKLFDELDLSGLDSLTPKLADAACWLLTKYHDMFSLDQVELGCTHSTEHMIKVMDDTPFKEWFR